MATESERIQATPEQKAGLEQEMPKRKRRTVTLSDEAYDTLSTAAEAQDHRSHLVENLHLLQHRTVALSEEAHMLLGGSAEAFGTSPERLTVELVKRCRNMLAWQVPGPVKPPPW